VFYHDIYAILDRIVQIEDDITFFQYSEFDAVKEIGAGGYGIVYKTKCKSMRKRIVVLKRFKNFDQIKMSELFFAEVSNHCTVFYFILLF
jgi:hypothetical protein